MSSWLLLSDHRLRQYFLGLFAIHLSLGSIRFLFPFQIINLGGDTTLISTASALFSGGQIIGLLILGVWITSNRTRFFLGGILLLLLMGLMSINGNPVVLSFARILEGLGYGILFLSVVSFASQFPNREGEVVGGLFAAIFSGLAVGQGIAGVLWRVLSDLGNISSAQTIQLIAGLTFLTTLIALIILRPALKSELKESENGWKWQHFHFRSWLRTLILFPSILLLLIVYSLYEFAHGLYTPNLSILLNQQGIDEIGLSFGYLIGDITWGISQLFAGKLVDKTGFSLPLVMSLLFKGIVVFFYPEISLLLALFTVLLLAGLAEGFLEPARNKAALSVEIQQNYHHSHLHIDLGFSSSGGFVIGFHKHGHEHNSKSDSLIGALQSIGILFFGIGSLTGSWFLIQGFTLETITIFGGFCLFFAGISSIFFSVFQGKNRSS
ncbi:MAG: MFS transporter [Candidatus Hodarchaeales archaeon]